jgi:hypothetical protein
MKVHCFGWPARLAAARRGGRARAIEAEAAAPAAISKVAPPQARKPCLSRPQTGKLPAQLRCGLRHICQYQRNSLSPRRPYHKSF